MRIFFFFFLKERNLRKDFIFLVFTAVRFYAGALLQQSVAWTRAALVRTRTASRLLFLAPFIADVLLCNSCANFDIPDSITSAFVLAAEFIFFFISHFSYNRSFFNSDPIRRENFLFPALHLITQEASTTTTTADYLV
jgi:hypothetical protein